MSKHWKRICLVLVVAIIAALSFLQANIDSIRLKRDYGEAGLGGTPPEEVVTVLVLGGFRAVAADLLWLRSINLKEEKKFYELRTLYELIAKLQPTFAKVWVFNGWNLAYNIANQWPSKEDNWKWVKAGVEFVSKGKQRNPDNVDILFYLGYIYFHKACSHASGEHYWYIRQRLMEEGVNPYEEAIKNFEAAAALGGHSLISDRMLEKQPFQVYRFWGEYLAREGEFEQAIEKYRKAASGFKALLATYPKDRTFGRLARDAEEKIAALEKHISRPSS